MSRPKLKSFLKKVQAEMRRNPNFRRYDANTAQNTFYFSPKELQAALLFEFKFRHIGHLLKEGTELHTFVKKRTEAMLSILRERYKSGLSHRNNTMEMTGNQHFMKVVLQTEINPKTNKEYDNFVALRNKYTEEMNDLARELTKKVSQLGEKLLKTKNKNAPFKGGKRDRNFNPADNERIMGTKLVDKGSDLAEAGHDEGFEILESKIQDAMQKAFNDEYPRRVDRKVLNRDLKKLGIDLEVERDDTSGTYQFRMQSTVDNQQKGFLSAKARQEFEVQLAEAIRKLDDESSILKLQGSPSMYKMKETELRRSALKPFEKIKNVKVEVPKEIKKKKRTERKRNKIRSKVSPTAAVAIKVMAPKRRKRKSAGSKKGMGFDALRIIGILNKDLPETVRKNMQPPRLQNQSGRFADSVRITDISSTPQGFPSIGYTYQRNPYQVFEEGSNGNWSNGQRDPRDLIDKSIREIAVQFAIGRFYTRRM